MNEIDKYREKEVFWKKVIARTMNISSYQESKDECISVAAIFSARKDWTSAIVKTSRLVDLPPKLKYMALRIYAEAAKELIEAEKSQDD